MMKKRKMMKKKNNWDSGDGKCRKGVIADVGATTVKDMGKVMGKLRPMLAGRADMSTVGDKIKAMLK